MRQKEQVRGEKVEMNCERRGGDKDDKGGENRGDESMK